MRRLEYRLSTTVLVVVVSMIAAVPAAAQQIALSPLTGPLPSNPVAITHAGDGSGRLFITLQDGRILIHDGGQLLATPFLDIRGIVLSGGERGLLSVAFHPGYPSTPYFFVDYTRAGDGATVIARYRVSAGDPNLADAGSGVVLLVIAQPFDNHNGGQVAFGSEGYLYIGMGDGGDAGDPLCHGQRDDSLLGKMLRIDVDQNVDTPPYYGIPPTNPFVGPGNPPDEVWAKGLRNPWRFSFDRANGDLLVADVGQGQREEIDYHAFAGAGGENYGWKVMEGTLCTGSTSGCAAAPPACNSPAYVLPVAEYAHDLGRCSITGGFVYRGTGLPSLAGKYIYGDWCTGEILAATPGAVPWGTTLLLDGPDGLTTFGEDEAGELYVAADSIFRVIATGADLAITKSDGRTSVTPGDSLAYTIVASNAGPLSVTGATVTDTAPAGLESSSWTCVGAGGGTCAASGSGNIADSIDLPVGGTATYVLSGTLGSSPDPLANTATITAPGVTPDGNLANNSATDTDSIVCAGETSLMPDGRSVALTLDAGATRWGLVNVRLGSSYSIEAVSAPGSGLPTLTMFSGDDGCAGSGTAVVRDTSALAPPLSSGARLSFTAAGTLTSYRARLRNPGAAPMPLSVSISETTLYSAAWSTGGTYNTYYSLSNTAAADIHARLVLTDTSGVERTAVNVTVPASTTASVNTSSLGTARALTGTASLSQDGPPGALVAEAVIANFNFAKPYVQPVKFEAVRSH